MASNLYFAWGALALVFAAAAVSQGRRLGPLVAPYFFGAWLAGELALQFLALHAVVTIGFAIGGALDTAIGIWGLTFTLAACGLLVTAHLRAIAARDRVVALAGEAGLDIDVDVSPHHAWLAPFRMPRPGVQRITDVAYGPSLPRDKGGRNLLDVVMPLEPGNNRPALLQIHGGGWTIGAKEQQAGPLMNHLAERGWVCFAMNYRLSPRAAFPDHIIDVKRAIAWFREHAHEYGADPSFLAVTGGSAGGHLSALTALSANDPAFQPGFEEVDTRVNAAVPFYGVFEFQDRLGVRGSQSMEPFLAKRVFQCTREENPELWNAMTPLTRVHAESPPFLVVHGSHDSLAYVEDAREFVRVLGEKSVAPIRYLELEGCQHAFDVFHSVRCQYAVRAATAFLESVHATHRS